MITKMQNIIIVLLAFSGTALYAADEQPVVERTAKKSSARKRYEARLGRRQSKQHNVDQQPQQPAKKKIKKSKKERVAKKTTEQVPQKSIRAERLAKKRAQAAERKKKAVQAQEQVEQKVAKRPVRRRKPVVLSEQSNAKNARARSMNEHGQSAEHEECAVLAERVNRLIAYVQHKEEERAAREQYKQLQKQSYHLQKELGH